MEKCLNSKCARFVIQVVRWVPVVFILAVISWAYYAYVYQLCIDSVKNPSVRIAYLFFFHFFFLMFLWSYFQTVMAPMSRPPEKFYITSDVREDLNAATNEEDHKHIVARYIRQQKLPVYNQSFDGGMRFCFKCACIKPDRSHHCSVCGQCILKFDHHCPWVNTCVNFNNYKFFILFLGYGFALCAYGFVTVLPFFIDFWQTDGLGHANFNKFHLLFLFFVSGMFAVSLACLFFYHLYLTARNHTTIESFRPPVFSYGPDKKGYNIGIRRNYRDVFGKNALLWLIPVRTSLGDGVQYPQRAQVLSAASQIGSDPFLDSHPSFPSHYQASETV
jgi:hypothetical protein